jgi:hypothetical protein
MFNKYLFIILPLEKNMENNLLLIIKVQTIVFS